MPLRRRHTENSLLRADNVASPTFDLGAGNSLPRADNVASPILDFIKSSSFLLVVKVAYYFFYSFMGNYFFDVDRSVSTNEFWDS